jgi:hypothetical protein
METIQEYSKVVAEQVGANDWEGLARTMVVLASKYSYLSEIQKRLRIERAYFWQRKWAGDKPLSDTHLKNLWLLTPSGEEEKRLKIEMKALEKLIDAIRSALYVLSRESRNDI